MNKADAYSRYDIQTEPTENIVKVPSRFRVKVKRAKLLKLIVKEVVETKGNMAVTMSRPCMYGVFGRPVGGMAPVHEKCVGCLRCTVEHPDMVTVTRNPAPRPMQDSFITPDVVDTILYEAHNGHAPVKGAGYRGKFGGAGWDGMWLDMSEIVRPTRDGIHGREFVSTEVDIGYRPRYLSLDKDGRPMGDKPRVFSLMVPFIFEATPSAMANRVMVESAKQLHTLAVVPAPEVVRQGLADRHTVPLVTNADLGTLDSLGSPRLVEIAGWDPDLFSKLSELVPGSLVGVRVPAYTDPVPLAEAGVPVIHLLADHHGHAGDRFMLELIRAAHGRLVEAGLREQVTLLGSGGMVMAEHMPKAIVCGLDAVGIDTAAWVALNASSDGACVDRANPGVTFPRAMTLDWGVRRMRNLTAAWRDQLLEILGAMGLREVRRLRGEVGRCMFQAELENEAFGEIEGYVART